MGQATTTPLEGMFTLDENGRILAASPSASELFGRTPDELAGSTFADLIAPSHRDPWIERFADLRDQPEAGSAGDRREAFALSPEGSSVFPVSLSTSAVVNGDVHRFVVVVHDRTRERRLERRLHDAQEEERRRVGHELHDSVGGQLTGVEIASSLLHKKLEQEGSKHVDDAADLVEHLRELHSRLRAVSRGLLPVADDPLGLMTALRRLTKRHHGRNGARFLFRCDGEVEVDDAGISSNLYYIAEEAVQNAVRHADASRVVIDLLAPQENEVVLEVRDDGAGLKNEAGAGSGIGMHSMAFRANLIGAHFQIGPAEPSGTRVRCVVDLDRKEGRK